MIALRFRSVGWVAAVATAALSCYLVTQYVAGEHQALLKVEHRILLSKREIRRLTTEIETRGRLGQLERWNRDVLALSAPRAGQYVEGELQLASFNHPQAPPPMLDPGVAPADAGVRTVSYAPVQAAPAAEASPEQPPMLRRASYVTAKGVPMTALPQTVALNSADFAADLAALALREAQAKSAQ